MKILHSVFFFKEKSNDMIKVRGQREGKVLVKYLRFFSSSPHEMILWSRGPLERVDVPLHSVFQRGRGRTLQLHVMNKASVGLRFGVLVSTFLLLLLSFVSFDIVLSVLFPLFGLVHHLSSFSFHLFCRQLLGDVVVVSLVLLFWGWRCSVFSVASV